MDEELRACLEGMEQRLIGGVNANHAALLAELRNVRSALAQAGGQP